MKKKELKVSKEWAENKLTHAQVKRELQVNGNTAYSVLARSLKQIHYETHKL